MRAQPQQSAAITVAVFPDLSRYNPYQSLLQGAVEKRGVQIKASEGRLSPLWVLRARRRVSAVHLHWVELLAFDAKRRYAFPRDIARSIRLWLSLRLLRRTNVRLVWTVHNLRPHERTRPRLFRLLERSAARAADAVVAHSRFAADAVEREIAPRGPVHVAYHGSFLGWYPAATEPREQLRARYGVAPDSFVFLMFGQVRPYKRLADAVRSFRGLKDERLRLLIAGQPNDDRDRRELEALAAGDPRVLLQLRWIGDEEVDGLHRASDVVVLNYPEVFSSSVLMLAWSLGRPLVAPAGGSVTELASQGPIETFEPGHLPDALERAHVRWSDDDPADECVAAARRFSWEDMAEVLRSLYSGETRP